MISSFLLASLDSFMIAAIALAAAAIIVFFVIFLCLDRKKQNVRQGNSRPKSKPAANNQIGEYKITEINLEQSNKFKHWGNLTLAERVATLSPGDKVLYAAVKKQLNHEKLKNFTTDICEVYFVGEQLASRLIIHRGLIYLFVNINPKKLDRKVYGHEDASDNEGFEMLPTMIIIKESAQTELIPGLVEKLV